MTKFVMHVLKANTKEFFFKKSVNDVSTSRFLQLTHMDLFGPIRTMSLGGKSYTFVLVDDFFRYTWFLFLRTKDDTLK